MLGQVREIITEGNHLFCVEKDKGSRRMSKIGNEDWKGHYDPVGKRTHCSAVAIDIFANKT